MSFQLDQVVPWGRSFGEYLCMFALTDGDLQKRILGCGDGPASFNAALSRERGRIISCDPVYRFSADEIRERIDETAAVIGEELAANTDQFVWRTFESVEDLIETRLYAMDEFLRDFPSGKGAGRYVDASLPELPFADDAFDLALCSHFLFLYGEHNDTAFHIEAIRELARVAREVRVFPIVELGSRPSRHLGAVQESLSGLGLSGDVVRVPYEFQRGGNEMLVVTRVDSA